MSSKNDIHSTVFSEIVKEIIGDKESGLRNPTDKILKKVIENIVVQLKDSKLEDTELTKYAKEALDRTADLLVRYTKDIVYQKAYNKFKEALQSHSYADLFSEIYEDEYYLCEIYVKIIEEQENIKITSPKQLQELIGITEIYGEWDEESQKIKPYNGKELTEKEAKEEAIRQINKTFTEAMYYRYEQSLKAILKSGGTYNDLLQIEPSIFNLPNNWEVWNIKNKQDAILWAISSEYLLDEPAGLTLLPSPRVIAKEIKAPYSVIMDAYNITRKYY